LYLILVFNIDILGFKSWQVTEIFPFSGMLRLALGAYLVGTGVLFCG